MALKLEAEQVVSIARLRELRSVGIKQVEFTAKGEIKAVEFFSEAPPEQGEPARVVPEEPEVPAAYMAAFADVQRRTPIKKGAPE